VRWWYSGATGRVAGNNAGYAGCIVSGWCLDCRFLLGDGVFPDWALHWRSTSNDSGGLMSTGAITGLLAAGVAALWVLDFVLIFRAFC
jgi:hypothetical protein